MFEEDDQGSLRLHDVSSIAMRPTKSTTGANFTRETGGEHRRGSILFHASAIGPTVLIDEITFDPNDEDVARTQTP